MDTKLLFVCLGNICRSPSAEGIMQFLVDQADLSKQIEVDSAGTYGGHAGERADARMRRAASARGYDLTSISRPLRSEDYDHFDMIIVMDDSNYEQVSRRAPSLDAQRKIYRMADFLRKHDWDHIPDPYYEGAEGFELVLDLLEDACGELLRQISEKNK